MTSMGGSSGPGAIAAALGWVEATVLGTISTAVAVIAVVSIGYLMLTGRIDVRRAMQVILGCFILFGASTIAAGIQGAFAGSGGEAVQPQVDALPPNYPVLPKAGSPQRSGQPFDPYAGAAVPTQQ